MAAKKRIAANESLLIGSGELNTEHITSRIEETILAFMHERDERSFCPSEVARRLEPKRWEPLMQPVREVAARLALEGRLVVTQRGKEVNAVSVRGPIRLKALESAATKSSAKSPMHSSTPD